MLTHLKLLKYVIQEGYVKAKPSKPCQRQPGNDNDHLRSQFVSELSYRILVWLAYRLAATFAVGLPLVLLIWALLRKETSMVRLLSIYWKIASLLGISMLLLTNQRPIGYLTFFIAPFLMVASVWFWVDLNEELADLPKWRPLPLTVRIWRWAISFYGLTFATLTSTSLPCMNAIEGPRCNAWLEIPTRLHQITQKLFEFLFGGNWNEPLAAFIGYLGLLIYTLGCLQWLLIRLPRNGRVAGDF